MIDDTFYNEISRHPLQTGLYRTVYRHSGRDWQDAEAIFFIHGGLTSGRWFEPAQAAFEELMPGKYACYAPDLPGCGEAEALAKTDPESLVSAMLAVLEEIGIRQAHFVGWDLGGAVASQLALRHPERCLSLTLLSSPGPTIPPEPLPANWPKLSSAIHSSDLENISRLMRANNFREGRFPANNTPPGNALISYLVQTALQTPNNVPEPNENSAIQLNLPEIQRLKQSAFKTLSLHGDTDPLISNELFDQLRKLWQPQPFEEIIFEGSSHAPHVEQPRRFAIELDHFFSHL